MILFPKFEFDFKRFNFDIKRITKTKRTIAKELQAGMMAEAQKVVMKRLAQIKRYLGARPRRTGIHYRKYRYRSSAVGESPRSQTGALKRSLRIYKRSKYVYEINSNKKYAGILEDWGRPFISRDAEQSQAEFDRRLTRVMERVSKKHGNRSR